MSDHRMSDHRARSTTGHDDTAHHRARLAEPKAEHRTEPGGPTTDHRSEPAEPDTDHRTPAEEVGPIARPTWLPEEVWPFAVRTYDHRGIPVHYLDEGTGPPLVLVHAGMWSFVWRDLVVALRARFRCLTVDFPGAGLSGGGDDDIDLAAYAELLVAWLDHLGIEQATFVVHDLGGVVGIAALADRPARAAGLVAVNSFAWPADTAGLRAMIAAVGSAPVRATLGTLRVVPRLTRTRFGVGRQLDGPSRDAFYGPYRESRARSRGFHRAMGSARRSTELFAGADAALRTSLSDLPLLTVFGERNDPFGFADRWRERFPGAESRVVDDGDHFPMCDEPSLVARWIEDWHERSVARHHAAATSQPG